MSFLNCVPQPTLCPLPLSSPEAARICNQLHTPVCPLLCPGHRAWGRRRGSTAGQDGSALGPPQTKALPGPHRFILTQFTGGKWTYRLECIVEGWKKSFPPL